VGLEQPPGSGRRSRNTSVRVFVATFDTLDLTKTQSDDLGGGIYVAPVAPFVRSGAVVLSQPCIGQTEKYEIRGNYI
jgi:hypothetical protein